ncbi:MAG: hypothetical protein ACI9TH_002689 [Kiritimatiellia bacterium]|jgi:hypothetical protein
MNLGLHRLFIILMLSTGLLASEDVHVFTAEEQSWWAVQPLQHPAVPDAGAGWARNTVDHFIARKHAAAKLSPAPEADRHELIRRACYDLHGLPPTPEQIEAFVQDARPDAWEQLIDTLLESPRYGERWAQHWLDVVRYAETDGYRADKFRPSAYRFRDYVIQAVNTDKPYDQFVREQLAADEFSDDPEILVATGFLRHGIYEYNQRDTRMHWDIIINEMTRVTGETFLGLGIGCAQCHDHKFDPILQKDYFALQSFLATTAWPTDRVLANHEDRMRHAEQTSIWQEATAGIREELDALRASSRKNKIAYVVSQFPEDIQAIYHMPCETRSPFEEQMAALVQRQVDEGVASAKPKFEEDDEKKTYYEDLEKKLAASEHLKPNDLPSALVATDVGPQPIRASFIGKKGKVEVAPAFLTLLGENAPEIQPTATTTGQRTALADWITRPDNQLATRVAVNRIWQHHFHQGLVATPNDLGTLGEEPSHPELLDWLARHFVQSNWQMKPMHRLIMTSATYRQTSRKEASELAGTIDEGNTLLWRYPPLRLSAEQIRDGMLAVSGELNTMSKGSSRSGHEPVRSVFVSKRRNSPDEVLAAFDAPTGFDSAPTRINTTTPTQALLLSNNEWPSKRAKAWASHLLKGKKEINVGAIEQAYLEAYGRPASEIELTSALRFILHQAEGIEQQPQPVNGDADGFEPLAKHFKDLKKPTLGDPVLNLERSGPWQQVDTGNTDWLDDTFTIEVVARLESVYANANVNTLFSRWNGKQAGTGGWAMGITSAKSAYEPQNFIMQLVGEDTAGNISYAVVDSDLKAPLNTPLYLAVVVSKAGKEGGRVTFYMKDLSDPKNPLQVNVVEHPIVRSLQQADTKLLIGGRDENGAHNWDGQVARVEVSHGTLPVEALLMFGSASRPERAYVFDGSQPVKWLETTAPVSGGIPRHQVAAMVDFCHALLISNEFLYLN